MQRATTPFMTASSNKKPTHSHKNKLALALLTAGMLSLTGCQTLKNITGDDDAVASAKKSDAQYYADAVEDMDKGRYLRAIEQLTELRTFYPTGPYAEQALLDLMYAQFQNKEYELAVTSAEEFIKLYPRNIQVDYAYYVRGVANMHAGTSGLLSFARLEQAHRDTSYYRLAFNNFQELLARYPTSSYAPDAAQRLTYIYNQFAESELAAARWYIKREAYVAAANRAKWVFQYYPLSEQVPESIAILAFSNQQLGLTDLAEQYRTLLQINYPEWLTDNGKVKISNNRTSSLLNRITYGKLGRAHKNADENPNRMPNYTGETKQQVIQQAAQLQLPDDNSGATNSNMPSLPTNRRGINLGLGLPEQNVSGPQQTAPQPIQRISSPRDMYPEDYNTPPQTPSDAEAGETP
ncbi:outer membrane protein assembly factor BamD [Psychrobacter sp. FDAARGOS_221]|uniref:outer membrane protein assembly factor BamD n=1 Tax=Psychrobacter sp. FDAARGOS_221 TaxID=1975705 RepID=UPI000BB57E7A|nr:outer membrane protein assembly factor BamD [Psychrobacter sp. FDAARGOS_221]PNK59890.1 outer membrane protein assembly factor BamD [Psychrobacter sp. FDAARGOS_221]